MAISYSKEISSEPLPDRVRKQKSELTASLPLPRSLVDEAALSSSVTRSAPSLFARDPIPKPNISLTPEQKTMLEGMSTYYSELTGSINKLRAGRHEIDERKQSKYDLLTAIMTAKVLHKDAPPQEVVKLAFVALRDEDKKINLDLVIAGSLSTRMRDLLVTFLNVPKKEIKAELTRLQAEAWQQQLKR